MAVIACFTHLLNWSIHRECLLVLESGMSRRKDVKKGWPVWATGDVGTEETEGLGLGEQRDRKEGLWACYLGFWQMSYHRS